MSPFPRATDGPATRSDFSIRIAPVKLELAPGNVVDTIGYNGTVPGPSTTQPLVMLLGPRPREFCKLRS
jgi:hypothetical protein